MDSRKNLLDLHFHKYVSYKNTVVIIGFSYFIAVFIPFLIGELSLSDKGDMLLVGGISSFLIVLVIISLNRFNYHLKRIPGEIRKLNSL